MPYSIPLRVRFDERRREADVELPRPHPARASAAKKWPASWMRIRKASPRIATAMLIDRARDELVARRGAPRRRPRRARRGRARAAPSTGASVRSTTSAMPRNGSRPRGTPATATSFAALRTHGEVPPRSPASRASASSGNASSSGACELERQAAREVERRHRRRRALRVRERVRDRHAHVRDSRGARARRRRGSGRARARSTSGGRRPRSGRTAGRRGSAPRSARGPCSRASPSRP